MKKLTCTSLIIALAMFFGAQSTMAESLDDQDMAFAFASESSMDMAMLSEQEMVETEGEFAWFAVPLILSLGAYFATTDTITPAGTAWAAASAIPVIKAGGIVSQMGSGYNGLKTVLGTAAGTSSILLNQNNPYSGGNNQNFGYQPPGNNGVVVWPGR